jgi:acetylornithine/N-succinyldiaminopimelate aminotransferase
MSDSHYEKTTELYGKYVMPTYAPKLLLTSGMGAMVCDSAGNEYLDFGSGISVCNLGHCHPRVTAAICEQAGRLVHVSNLYMNEQQPRLAQKLIEQGFDGVAFFSNSGAEANEGMIKFARKWGSDKGRHEIIVMDDSFHGRTLATLAATGRAKYRKDFGPDMPGFKHVPFNDLNALKNAIGETTAAVMLEPVQGEGGVMPADADYLSAVRELCDEAGILLLFDEVQCGMGRTGTFYAWQGYGVQPDALSLAKALGNGYPIGAFLVKNDLANTLTVGTHASTFGGTPLACAAACAVIDTYVEEDVLANCQAMSAYLFRKLEELKNKFTCVQKVRGRGLMVGIVLDCDAGDLIPLMLEQGVIALTAGENVLRLLPPLNVTVDEINTAVAAIEAALKASR